MSPLTLIYNINIFMKKKNQSPLSINILKCLWGKKIGNESEKKLHSRKVDPNRPNGPSELK